MPAASSRESGGGGGGWRRCSDRWSIEWCVLHNTWDGWFLVSFIFWSFGYNNCGVVRCNYWVHM